jgi:hypothetical protein
MEVEMFVSDYKDLFLFITNLVHLTSQLTFKSEHWIHFFSY